MNLHTDLPTRADIDRLMERRHPASVSVYLATDPASSGEAERIELKNLVAEALAQLEAVAASRADCVAIEEGLAELDDDAAFWRHQARSLALFATPDALLSYRLPHRLVSLVEVSDRFYLKPLLRAVTFPQVAIVLALAQGSVRVLEVAGDTPVEALDVPDLPGDVASAAGKSSIADRSPSGRLQGSEGQKVRMRQYARQVDQALRPLLAGSAVPLVLAAAEPLASIYRSVNTYPGLAATTVEGSPEGVTDVVLAAGARTVLDELYASELRELRALFETRASAHRATADLTDVARASTFGAVDTLFVDIDQVVPGFVDETSGAVALAEPGTDDAVSYGVVDEIARRTWLAGGRVLAVRADDVPGGGSVAAILRYPV